ncbi:MAG: hypothetical protein N2450_03835 [bacterium]|nr:hypothetical protein [bacterium]
MIILLPQISVSQTLLTVGLEYNEQGKPIHLVISGKISSPFERYVGISIYPEGITDVLKEGIHSYRTVKPNKEFLEKIPLQQITLGSYEVSLWEKKVPKNLAQDQDNFFVKLWGFHFEGQLSYQYGSIFPMK